MRGTIGIVTLILAGVITANLAVNYKGVVAGLGALNQILATSYTAMLGQAPTIPASPTR